MFLYERGTLSSTFFGLPKMEKIAATSSSRRPPLAVVLGRCIRNRRSEPLHRRNQWRFFRGRWQGWRNCGITSTSRLGFLSEEHTHSSTGSNSVNFLTLFVFSFDILVLLKPYAYVLLSSPLRLLASLLVIINMYKRLCILSGLYREQFVPKNQLLVIN